MAARPRRPHPFDFKTIGLARCQKSCGSSPMDSAPTPNRFLLAFLLRPAPEQKGKRNPPPKIPKQKRVASKFTRHRNRTRSSRRLWTLSCFRFPHAFALPPQARGQDATSTRGRAYENLRICLTDRDRERAPNIDVRPLTTGAFRSARPPEQPHSIQAGPAAVERPTALRGLRRAGAPPMLLPLVFAGPPTRSPSAPRARFCA
jgi:hypothetical protein